MRQVLLCIAMCLLATSISGMPQGHDRPVTNPPPQFKGSIQEYLCEVLNDCNTTSQSPQPQPDQTQPDQPQPDQPKLQVQPDNATEENLSQTCQCVMYFNCKSRTSNKNKVAISLSGRRVEECHYLQRCCDEENIIKYKPTKSSIIDERAAPL